MKCNEVSTKLRMVFLLKSVEVSESSFGCEHSKNFMGCIVEWHLLADKIQCYNGTLEDNNTFMYVQCCWLSWLVLG